MNDISKDRQEFLNSLKKINVGHPTPSFLFLDTATKYTGYAIMRASAPHLYELVYYGLIKPPTNYQTEIRSLAIAGQVAQLVSYLDPYGVIMEYPTYQGGARGVAASQSGDTLKLAELCGMVHAFLMNVIITCEPKVFSNGIIDKIAYLEWGGQTNKQMTCNRLKRYFYEGLINPNPNTIDNNWADAIAMGKWYIESRVGGVLASTTAGQQYDLPCQWAFTLSSVPEVKH